MGRTVVVLEALVLAGFFVFYLSCFDRESAVNGPYEVFGQDSVYILDHLEKDKLYPWNPQNHLLYHVVIDGGYQAWRGLVGSGSGSAYGYLKLSTALCGLGFLAAMRWLFVELGLSVWPRIALLLLCGVTMSAWFHFAAFETHALAMPALALYLVALVRLRRPERSATDRCLFVGSLLLCGLTRVDLFRLAAVSGVLLVLPCLRDRRRTLAADLGLVAVLGVAGSTALAHFFLGWPFPHAITASLARMDREELGVRVGRMKNLRPRPLSNVAQAVTLYSLVMPVERREEGRSFFAPPAYVLDLEYSGEGRLPSTQLFLEPARRLLGSAIGSVALAAAGLVLLSASGFALVGAARGDPLHATLLTQAIVGWLFYAWFNPYEPFLWVAEFMPLWIAMIADGLRGRGRAWAVALAVLACCIWLHNWFAFYLPFR